MGMIKVIGIGPGGKEDMTPRALNAILEADTVAGYNTYIKLIKHLLDGKNVIGTGMMQEVDRCKMAIEEAVKGHNVAVVSSGDSVKKIQIGHIIMSIARTMESIERNLATIAILKNTVDMDTPAKMKTTSSDCSRSFCCKCSCCCIRCSTYA